MENPGSPRRRLSARMMGWMLGASVLLCLVPSVAHAQAHWQVSYPPAPNGRAAESAATPIEGNRMMVAVVTPGANASLPTVRLGSQKATARMIGYDPVSSLSFLNVDGGAVKAAAWRENTNGIAGSALQAQTPAGPVNCRATGWIKQVGTKILPLALLQVTFDQAVPPPGTPLLDSHGKIAAVVFQPSGTAHTGYAIPAEAVHRVRRDISNGGHLVRGYLGLSLRAETKSPTVVQVLPNSPAAAAIQSGDVLLTVGTHSISDYADAANAFFYLIPGQPVRITLMRGGKQLAYTLTPTRPPAK